MYYLLLYEYVEDMAERRTPYREAHLKIVGDLKERGILITASAYSNPLDGAALIFDGKSKAVIEDFVRRDPYVLNGLVPRHRIHEWNATLPGS